MEKCIEEKIFVEGYGFLKYSLSNNFRAIILAMLKRSGVGDLTIDVDAENVNWSLNVVLSENVKKLMDKHNVEFSMTMEKEGQGLDAYINRRIGDKWFSTYFGDDCIEEEVYLEEIGEILNYTLSDNLNEMELAIHKKTGYGLQLNNDVMKVNPHLSTAVKNMMNNHNVEYSMTVYSENGNINIAINRRYENKWFSVLYTEDKGSFYIK